MGFAYVPDDGRRAIFAALGGCPVPGCIGGLFPARFFPELLSLEGDVGGSAVIKRHLDDLLLFEAPETELCDVDTKEALEALKKR